MERVLKELPALFCNLDPEGTFPGVLLTDSLNSWNFAFLKFRALTFSAPCACTPSLPCCRICTWPNRRQAAHPKNKLASVYQAHPSADYCWGCPLVLSPPPKKFPTTQQYLVGRPWPGGEAGAGGCCGRVARSGQRRRKPAAVPRCPPC